MEKISHYIKLQTVSSNSAEPPDGKRTDKIFGNPSITKYDSISGLTLASLRHSSKHGDLTEGYVNEEGVFMIVKAKESKW